MMMTSGMYHILFEHAKDSEYKVIKNGVKNKKRRKEVKTK